MAYTTWFSVKLKFLFMTSSPWDFILNLILCKSESKQASNFKLHTRSVDLIWLHFLISKKYTPLSLIAAVRAQWAGKEIIIIIINRNLCKIKILLECTTWWPECIVICWNLNLNFNLSLLLLVPHFDINNQNMKTSYTVSLKKRILSFYRYLWQRNHALNVHLIDR